MKVNITETGEEVTTSFDDDAAALMGSDGSALDRLFWTSTQIIRFSAAQKLLGGAHIAEFTRASTHRIVRQSHPWAHPPDRRNIVASLCP
ncbi:conserved hypothetical protein [Roseovarius sp. EC-HK134]|uniref:AtzH-like domain-containing protein n=1 Tax=unclassified Roseovarius TaxID=2614913 RepID=UPI00125B4E15|nr:AtzH-like domain-containing protein [Roseovarius sp. EC-HK134]VVT09923.1 conserved hypothetical protein [Roseovarius sp. EC-HK134]VVT10152.1 conserved hypothetical protein [Roseovarius sp. EC-SD190]